MEKTPFLTLEYLRTKSVQYVVGTICIITLAYFLHKWFWQPVEKRVEQRLAEEVARQRR